MNNCGRCSPNKEKPPNTDRSVLAVHDCLWWRCCKERSDGIAIVTLCVNRVQSQSLNSALTETSYATRSSTSPLSSCF